MSSSPRRTASAAGRHRLQDDVRLLLEVHVQHLDPNSRRARGSAARGSRSPWCSAGGRPAAPACRRARAAASRGGSPAARPRRRRPVVGQRALDADHRASASNCSPIWTRLRERPRRRGAAAAARKARRSTGRRRPSCPTPLLRRLLSRPPSARGSPAGQRRGGRSADKDWSDASVHPQNNRATRSGASLLEKNVEPTAVSVDGSRPPRRYTSRGSHGRRRRALWLNKGAEVDCDASGNGKRRCSSRQDRPRSTSRGCCSIKARTLIRRTRTVDAAGRRASSSATRPASQAVARGARAMRRLRKRHGDRERGERGCVASGTASRQRSWVPADKGAFNGARGAAEITRRRPWRSWTAQRQVDGSWTTSTPTSSSAPTPVGHSSRVPLNDHPENPTRGACYV